jgi:molybdopterin synthase sulfur carrier subunit
MAIKVLIPTPLQKFTNNEATILLSTPLPKFTHDEASTEPESNNEATILLSTPLLKFTHDEASTEPESNNIVDLLNTLDKSYPGIKARLCDDSGELRRFVNFYVNSEDIRFLNGKETALNEGDEVSIVPAVAGG